MLFFSQICFISEQISENPGYVAPRNTKKTLECLWKEVKMKVLVAQSCQTLWDPMDCGLGGSSVHGILEFMEYWSGQPKDRTWVFHIAGRFITVWASREAPRILKWVATPFSRGSSRPRGRTQVSEMSVHSYKLRNAFHWTQ